MFEDGGENWKIGELENDEGRHEANATTTEGKNLSIPL